MNETIEEITDGLLRKHGIGGGRDKAKVYDFESGQTADDADVTDESKRSRVTRS